MPRDMSRAPFAARNDNERDFEADEDQEASTTQTTSASLDEEMSERRLTKMEAVRT